MHESADRFRSEEEPYTMGGGRPSTDAKKNETSRRVPGPGIAVRIGTLTPAKDVVDG